MIEQRRRYPFILLTAHEVQSGHDRQQWAEGLIVQLPPDHDGRNSWLLNYGMGDEAVALRERRGLTLDPLSRAIDKAAIPKAPEAWRDIETRPRDETALAIIEPTEKNTVKAYGPQVLPVYFDDHRRVCCSGTWKPDPGIADGFFRAIAWQPLPGVGNMDSDK